MFIWYVADAGEQGLPKGLFVVAVIVTVLFTSPAAGVYVKLNGELPKDDVVKLPAPFSLKVTLVADPPKLLLGTTIGVNPH
jgi:hypothetical protein